MTAFNFADPKCLSTFHIFSYVILRKFDSFSYLAIQKILGLLVIGDMNLALQPDDNRIVI